MQRDGKENDAIISTNFSSMQSHKCNSNYTEKEREKRVSLQQKFAGLYSAACQHSHAHITWIFASAEEKKQAQKLAFTNENWFFFLSGIENKNRNIEV